MKVWLLAGVVWLLVVGSAEASTVISAESGTAFPYQRWVDQAKVPTPDVTLRVVGGISDERCNSHASGCTVPSEGTIWLRADLLGWLTRFVFLHELGHNYFYAAGVEDTERMADDYAYCAIGLRRARRVGLGHSATTRQLCYRLRRLTE